MEARRAPLSKTTVFFVAASAIIACASLWHTHYYYVQMPVAASLKEVSAASRSFMRNDSKAAVDETASEMNAKLNETSYLLDLLAINVSSNDEVCVPLHLDTFRRARVVQGDVTLLRLLIDKIVYEKQCVKALVFGGSCSSGHGLQQPTKDSFRYLKRFEMWLNDNFPCSKTGHPHRHEIDTNYDSNDIGTPGTPTAFWDASMRIGVDSWTNYSCDPYNLFLFETATNSDGKPMNVYYTELIIRNFLLCRNRAALVFVEATQSPTNLLQQIPLHSGSRGDLEQHKVLSYYQIPTVSLSASVYPLMWRYYLNGLQPNTSNTSAFSYELRKEHAYLFEHENHIKDAAIYKDEHYSNEHSGGHLRVDAIHPTAACHKFMSYLLQYLLMSEYKQMEFERSQLRMNEFDVLHRNHLYLEASANSLPPIAFLRQYSATWPDAPGSDAFVEKLELMTYLANHHIGIPLHISFENARFIDKTKARLAELVTQNQGGWSLIGETQYNKYGYICNVSIACKLSIDLNAARDSSTTRYLMRISYLEAYDQMASVAVWIDEKVSIEEEGWPHSNVSHPQLQVFDALHEEKTSQAATKWWIYHQSQPTQPMYLHLMIIDSEPKRDSNKFKLLTVAMCTLH